LTAFWIAAALLTVVAAAILFLPTLRRRRVGERWSAANILVAATTPLVAIGIYSGVTTWNPEIANRSSAEWAAIGRDRFLAEDYAAARTAYIAAYETTPAPSNALKMSLAEALIITEPESLLGTAGMLVEDVLAAEPGNVGELFYGALAATQRGDLANARERFSRMLALDLPPRIEELVRAQVAALAAAESAASGGGVAPNGGETQQDPPAGKSLRVRVSLGEGRSMPELGPQARLFISARATQGAAGPPVAALQLPPSAIPGEFTLSDADSLMGRQLSSVEEVAVTARISANGDATGQPGDLQAEPVTARVGSDDVVELVIDSVAQ
jgi:hypothetical protein